MNPAKGSRKVEMLRSTRQWMMLFFIVYIGGEYITDLDSVVVSVIAGSIGGGLIAANWANAAEYKGKE